MKAINGCEADSTEGERWEIGPYKLKRCPVKVVTEEGLEYLQAYKFYAKGQLPTKGGWLDQTQGFVEAMGIIEREISEMEREAQKTTPRLNR